jgi:RNA polymerase subunit RPABC4/transcription elongation factor Spt4
MTKCKACKSKIKNSVDYCPFCGEPLKGKDTAHLILILDRSGSMSSVKDATIEGFNQFISDQKKVPLPATISLYQFDDVYEAVYENIDLKDVDYLNDNVYQPRNTTALFDAIGKTINNYLAYHDSLSPKERPKKVLFCIITDGAENASTEFKSRKAVKSLMDSVKKKYKWEFSFIGAGIDAYTEAESFGIARGQTLKGVASAQGLSNIFTSHSTATASYRGGTGAFSYKD